MKIGQEVFCIRGTSRAVDGRRLVKGEIYTIKDICKCGCSPLVDVGFLSKGGTRCPKCNYHLTDNIWWFYANRFVPIDDIDISILNEQIKAAPAEAD